MKRTLILLMAMMLLTGAVAIPAFAEEADGTPDQITSATVQTGKETPDSQQQIPGGSQLPRIPGSTQNGRMPGMPGQNSRNGQNDQQSGTPGRDGNGMRQGRGFRGRNDGTAAGRHGKGGKHIDPDQLLAEGVISQEVYDAIMNWLNTKAQQPAVPAVPADPAEAPAAPETTQESSELQLLKQLLESGAITQEQYDLLAGQFNAPDPAGTV